MGSVQHEIHQRTPFASAGQEATISLLRTTEVVRRRLTAVIEPAGITVQQYNVLRILRGAGAPGLPTLDIAERLIERAPGITRLCDGLEREGYLSRVRATDDRRVVRCRITQRGRTLLARLDAPVDRADREAVAPLSAGELRTLIGLLDRIRHHGEAEPPRRSTQRKGQ